MAKATSDQRLMAAALRLARRGLGRTWPNPSVGALVVDRNGAIAGRGWTADGGRPHAERIALDEAGALANGATMYVSLEPCAHHGQTPPCAEQIVEAGIRRVVCALDDPDNRVAGRGYEILQQAGIGVHRGVCGREAARICAGHVTRVTRQRPFIQLKMAVSRDGRIARSGNKQVAITGILANRWVHRMRVQADAIMVGIGTIRADNPALTCRLPGAEKYSPIRVGIDRDLAVDLESRLVRTAGEVPTWIMTGDKACDERRHALERRNVRIFPVKSNPDGRVDLRAVMAILAGAGITRLLVEGGARLAGSLIADGLADEVILIEGQTMIGNGGLLPFAGQDTGLVTNSRDYVLSEQVPMADDLARFYRYRG